MKRWLYSFAIAVALLLNQRALMAQGPQEQPDITIDSATRSAVIEDALKKLNDYYVFPETAKKMEQAVRDRIARKEYDQITSAKTLATTLQSHLQEVSHDKHLRVMYSFRPTPPETERRQPGPEEQARELEFLRTINFGSGSV